MIACHKNRVCWLVRRVRCTSKRHDQNNEHARGRYRNTTQSGLASCYPVLHKNIQLETQTIQSTTHHGRGKNDERFGGQGDRDIACSKITTSAEVARTKTESNGGKPMPGDHVVCSGYDCRIASVFDHFLTTISGCWASSGYSTAGCAALEQNLRKCMDERVCFFDPFLQTVLIRFRKMNK